MYGQMEMHILQTNQPQKVYISMSVPIFILKEGGSNSQAHIFTVYHMDAEYSAIQPNG